MAADSGGSGGENLRVWAMTTGETGSRHQALGLAQAVSPIIEEHIVRVSRLAALAPPHLFSRSLVGVASTKGFLEPPWPDVLISCGRRASLAAMAVRRRAGQPMVLVHIQPPPAPAAFDLIVALPHDRIAGPNVVQVQTAMHRLRAGELAAAKSRQDSRFAGLPRPWTGVILGGATNHKPFSNHDAERLIAQLDVLRAAHGGSLLIVRSRRTPPGLLEVLLRRYGADPAVFLWNDGIANPYAAILAQSDRLVVTSDSISMVSEALATDVPVFVFKLAGGERHGRFIDNLLANGLAGALDTALSQPLSARRAVDATLQVADEVRRITKAALQGEPRRGIAVSRGSRTPRALA